MPTPNKDAVLIAGPTASGKSALAIAIAKEVGGEVVNGDAIQVYKELCVLSARPTTDEMAGIPHHLFGHVEGATRYSSGIWAQEAGLKVNQIFERGKIPVIVGGTGLYFRALTEGLSEIPDVSSEIRDAVLAQYDAQGPEDFRKALLQVDPAMARLEPADKQRHLRAYEVFKATGQPLSYFQSLPGQPVLNGNFAKVILAPNREALYQRCEDRFDGMIKQGALDEARALMAFGYDPALPVMKALGAAELITHLQGELSLDEAIDLAKRNTRRFAKRQMTWFRNQHVDWPIVEDATPALNILATQLGVKRPGANAAS